MAVFIDDRIGLYRKPFLPDRQIERSPFAIVQLRLPDLLAYLLQSRRDTGGEGKRPGWTLGRLGRRAPDFHIPIGQRSEPAGAACSDPHRVQVPILGHRLVERRERYIVRKRRDGLMVREASVKSSTHFGKAFADNHPIERASPVLRRRPCGGRLAERPWQAT